MGQLRDALSKICLGSWSRKFGNIKREVAKSPTQLEELMNMNADRQDIRTVTDKMNDLLYRGEMMWLQRSRITWLKEGERNTAYLHRRAVWRARCNFIQRLRRENGMWCTVPSEMERMATSYFKEVYTKDPTLSPGEVLRGIAPKVTEAMNDKLCSPFSEEEVSTALIQIGPIKAPGTDGLHAIFFKCFWHIVRDELTK